MKTGKMERPGQVMPENIKPILDEYRENIRKIFGESYVQMILYGSYARGDNHAGSDIDIMILTKLTDEEIAGIDEQVTDMTYEFNWDHKVEIMPIVKNAAHFNYWKGSYIFYRNVDQEGVVLS